MVSFRESIKTCLTKKYFTVSGRATRAEYWWFQLFILLILIGFVLTGILIKHDIVFFILGVFYLFMVCPLFCVQIRRLHDVGHSGWLVLLSLIPYIGGLIIFITLLSGSDDDNKWGPNPYKSTIPHKEKDQAVEHNVSDKDNVVKTEVEL